MKIDRANLEGSEQSIYACCVEDSDSNEGGYFQSPLDSLQDKECLTELRAVLSDQVCLD